MPLAALEQELPMIEFFRYINSIFLIDKFFAFPAHFDGEQPFFVCCSDPAPKAPLTCAADSLRFSSPGRVCQFIDIATG
jgi:hypothetical protein